jgi:hypothetical protein
MAVANGKRAWHLSSDETPLLRENVDAMPTFGYLSDLGECLGDHALHRDPPISDGREAAVDVQLHPIHEARIV